MMIYLAGSGDPAYVYLSIYCGDYYLRKKSDVTNKIRRSRDRRYIILCVLCGDDGYYFTTINFFTEVKWPAVSR